MYNNVDKKKKKKKKKKMIVWPSWNYKKWIIIFVDFIDA